MTLVEGLVAGRHRSPLRGQSLEFSQHREYVPGDDLRQVDWKVFARSDKHYVRQYEDETNLTAMILLDISESMDYRSSEIRPFKTSIRSIDCLQFGVPGHIATRQRWAGHLHLTTAPMVATPAHSPVQLEDMIRLMEQPRSSKAKSSIPQVMQQCLDRLNKPILLILISDLLDQPEEMLRSFELLHLAGHDLLVIHVLDPWEISFPFDQTSQFDGLEGIGTLVVDPLNVAGAYRRAMQAFCQQLEVGCLQREADYFRLTTDQSLAVSLPNILSQRNLRRR